MCQDGAAAAPTRVVRRRSGQCGCRLHTNVTAPARIVATAAVAPNAGCASCARMTDDMASTNQPNALRSASGFTRDVSRAPTNAPTSAAAVTAPAAGGPAWQPRCCGGGVPGRLRPGRRLQRLVVGARGRQLTELTLERTTTMIVNVTRSNLTSTIVRQFRCVG